MIDGNHVKLSFGTSKLIEGEYATKLQDDVSISIISEPEETNNNWFVDLDSNRIKKSVFSKQKHFKVIDNLPNYNWQITNEKDKFGEYEIIKATTTFRGRNFIAWFAPSIPVTYGPWKLHGLPGLILKLYDEEKQFKWTLQSLNLNPQFEKTAFEMPVYPNEVEMTYKESLQMLEKEQLEKQKRQNTKLMGRGRRFEVKNNTDLRLEKVYEWEEEEK
ncbi:MAG: GLPGLI family protein [Flavobacteriaceae bacterium]|nr:GLPGLI family protein [Flavobacteriaceae bacterium]